MERLRLRIDGMSCQSCAARVEKVLNAHPAVSRAEVSFATEEARIDFDAAAADAAQLAALVERAGFSAHAVQGTTAPLPAPAPPDWRLKLLLVLMATFIPGMAGMLFGSHALMPPLWWQIVAATLVQVWLAQPFYRRAWAALRGGSANMDVLVAAGTSAAYLYSLVSAAQGAGTHGVYFETGVMVLALVSLGKYWEERMKRESLNGLALLVKLVPKTVQAQRNGEWVEIEVAQIGVGEHLRGVHGGRIAADGTVLSGEAWADESHLTGESRPVAKRAGDKVLAGAVLHGSLEYRADKLGEDTLLGDMMRALAEAQSGKAPAAALADRVAAVFVPLVAMVALLTFAGNLMAGVAAGTAVMRGVAVLVVACPCALGLATPAAVMAGMAAAVRHGVWFKHPAALESAAAADTAVFDKTGTLTEGRPDIIAVHTTADTDETRLLQAAAALERHSLHPFAAAIVRRAHQLGDIPAAQSVHTEAGQGISGTVTGMGEVRVGSPQFCGLTTLPDNETWQEAGIAAVAINGKPAGAFAFADTLKPDSRAAVARLQNMGIATLMLSGDRPAAVARSAAEAGIARAQGGMSPRDKTDTVTQLAQSGKHIAMIGDGINDAPALAAAHIGFAPYGSSAAAEHTAQAVLMRPSLMRLADAFAVARATRRTIRQNLFFAFAYNVLAIPLAATGTLSPTVAGMAMALSSVSVLTNSLRLHRFGQKSLSTPSD